MEFSPFNPRIKLCLQGILAEENGRLDEAHEVYLQFANQAENALEKFLAAFYHARIQSDPSEKLLSLKEAMELAQQANADAVKPAFPLILNMMADCFDQLGDLFQAQSYQAQASKIDDSPTDQGPFYHGTKADLQVGDFLTPGRESNYQADLVMNHIYLTALLSGAGLAAGLAKGEGRDRIYIVRPTGSLEHDPNVTNKKFPGNPTRSYRTSSPLEIVGEVEFWEQQMPEELQKWRERLAKSNGEIIN